MPGLRNKFNSTVVSKLNTLLTRNNWKHSEEPVTDLQRQRLENMTVVRERERGREEREGEEREREREGGKEREG